MEELAQQLQPVSSAHIAVGAQKKVQVRSGGRDWFTNCEISKYIID